MFFIPAWITNLVLFFACVISAYQHTRLNRQNPLATVQFGIIVLSLFIIVANVIVSRHNHDPWVSLVFFLVAATIAIFAYRQFRMLPPNKLFE